MDKHTFYYTMENSTKNDKEVGVFTDVYAHYIREVPKKMLRGKQIIKNLNELQAKQTKDAYYDYSEYANGLYNGLETALDIAEGREPKYIFVKEKQVV